MLETVRIEYLLVCTICVDCFLELESLEDSVMASPAQ